MSVMASQITSLTIVYSTVCSDQRKHQSSTLLAFCAGNSAVTGESPAQRASDVENVSIWWRHHDCGTKKSLHILRVVQCILPDYKVLVWYIYWYMVTMVDSNIGIMNKRSRDIVYLDWIQFDPMVYVYTTSIVKGCVFAYQLLQHKSLMWIRVIV